MHGSKKILAVTLIVALLISLLPFVNTSAATTWDLVWSDEFDGSTINTSNWTYDIGTGSSGWGNNELEYYTNRSDNARIENGSLVIEARKESYGGKQYTSARLKTQNLKSWTYGKVEASIKLPKGQGIWPAFWMLGSNIPQVNWPYCGEIDIMEHINNENTAHGTMHWDSNGHQSYGGSFDNLDVTQYHTYSIEWDANSIKWSVDGNQYLEGNIKNSVNGTEEFHKPFFIILNMAVGGNWPGSPNTSTVFPAKMYVDYVRVYKPSSEPPPPSTPSGTNLALNKPVTFSGQQEGNEAIHAVDGDTSNRWSSQVFPQWINVDLGDVYNISATEVIPYMDRAYQFKVEASTDGSNYTQIVDRTANTTGGSSIANTFTGTNARYVKLTVTGCYNDPTDWTSISEFRVFGEPVTPPPTSDTSLALNKPVTFSGQQEGNEATHAVDGDTSTRWSSQVFPQWINVDLGAVYNVNKTEVVPYMDRAYQFKVEVSTDGSKYTQVVDRTANTTGGSSIANTFTGTNARYVKLTVTGCYNDPTDWTSIGEFRVFGDTATPPPPPSEPETGYSYLTAMANQSIVCADNYGNDPLIANRTSAGGWESFQIINNSDGTISLLSKVNGKYVCADLNQEAKLIARSSVIDAWEKFQKVAQPDGTIALKALANNQYVCCDLNLGAVLYANRAAVGGAWETFKVTNINDTTPPPSADQFVHPGILNSQQDLDFIKAQVNSSTSNATKNGYNKMVSDFRASTTYTPTAYETVTVLGSGSTTSEDSYRNDAHAAYANALRWVITGNSANRDKSIQILNAWSYKFRNLANINQPNQPTLEASWALPIWVSAAEIIRHYNNGAAGWSQADINQFESFVDRQLAYVKGNAYDAANWKSSIALAIMAAGVFKDDMGLYNDGYNRMVTEIGKIGSNGKLPETDRDFVHAQYGLIGMAQGAEIAFQQGKGDLYGKKYNGESKPRLLLGSEYFVQCLLGTPISGGPNYSSDTKHNPPYEMILTRYKYDYNMAVPKTEQFVTTQNRSTDLWENHFVGWTTLTHANLP